MAVGKNRSIITCAHFSSMYIEIGKVQTKLPWSLPKSNTQTHEAFYNYIKEVW